MNIAIAARFVRYVMIGGGAAVADLFTFQLFYNLGSGVVASNFAAVSVGMMLSFFLNSYFNYRKTDFMFRRFVRFLFVALFGFIFGTIVIFSLNALGIQVLIAKIASMAFVAILQFTLNSVWTFRSVK